MGVGSMLAEMAIWARQNHPFGEIWMLPLADPAGVAQTTPSRSASAFSAARARLVYVGGEKVRSASPRPTPTRRRGEPLGGDQPRLLQVRPQLSFPVIATVASNVVTLTARNIGALGNKQSILKDLVGDEGPLQTYLTVAAGVTAGTGVPTLGAACLALGDQEFDFICSPYADTTSLDTIKDFLGGTSGRWSPIQQIYGHYLTVMFDTFSNLAAFGTGRNDPNVSIMGVVEAPSPPWRWAAAYGARIAGDKNLGGEVDQAYRISRPVQTLDLVGIRPPQSRVNWFTITQRNTLYQDGIAGFKVRSTAP
jgi:phage tail sheath gpL-like